MFGFEYVGIGTKSTCQLTTIFTLSSRTFNCVILKHKKRENLRPRLKTSHKIYKNIHPEERTFVKLKSIQHKIIQKP